MRRRCFLPLARLATVFGLLVASCPVASQTLGWTMIDSVTPRIEFRGIDCFDDRHCVTLGRDLAYQRMFVYRTTDGGATWGRIAREEEHFEGEDFWGRYLAIAHPSPSTIVVTCAPNIFLSTTDAGATWRVRELPEPYIERIAFVDSLHGIVSGYKGVVVTTDGGETWNAEYPRDTTALSIGAVAISQPGRLLVLGAQLTPLSLTFTMTSRDTGKSWLVSEPSIEAYRNDIMFIDETNGWISGSLRLESDNRVRDMFYRTTDGGATWEHVHDAVGTPPWEITDIDFADAAHGIAGGIQTKLQMTTDGGRTWERQFIQTDMERFSQIYVAYPSVDRAFAVSAEGGIYRFDRVSSASAPGPSAGGLSVVARTSPGLRVVLAFGGARGVVRYTVYDALGQFVTSGASRSDRAAAEITGLRPGLYLVRASDAHDAGTATFVAR